MIDKVYKKEHSNVNRTIWLHISSQVIHDLYNQVSGHVYSQIREKVNTQIKRNTLDQIHNQIKTNFKKTWE